MRRRPLHGSSAHSGSGSPGPIGGGSHPENGQFTIKGVVTGLWSPGMQQPINLSFTNPFGFSISITSVTVSVRPDTSKHGHPNPACSGAINLVVVRALTARPTIAQHSTVSLEQLGVPQSQWPLLRMPDLPANQDACKNTTFGLVYAGSATRS